MACEIQISQLLSRRRDIVDAFLRRLGISIPALKTEYGSVLRQSVEDGIVDCGSLEAYLDEIREGGKHRFFFCGNIQPREILTSEEVEGLREQAPNRDYLYAQPNDSKPVFQRISSIDDYAVRFEFEQLNDFRIPAPDSRPPAKDVEPGVTIVYEAYRVFRIPRISWVDWYPKLGRAIIAIAQQKRQANYEELFEDLTSTFATLSTNNVIERLPLNTLLNNLNIDPKIKFALKKLKTSQGSCDLSTDNAEYDITDDPDLASTIIALADSPMWKARVTFLKSTHPALSSNIIAHINAFDGYANIRQDATPEDIEYVINYLQRLL